MKHDGILQLMQMVPTDLALANMYASRIPERKLKLDVLLFHFDLPYTDNNIGILLRSLIMRIPRKSLCISNLMEKMEKGSFRQKQICLELLITHFGKCLSWQFLLKAQASLDAEIRRKARVLLLAIPKECLDNKALDEFIDSQDFQIHSMASELRFQLDINHVLEAVEFVNTYF